MREAFLFCSFLMALFLLFTRGCGRVSPPPATSDVSAPIARMTALMILKSVWCMIVFFVI